MQSWLRREKNACFNKQMVSVDGGVLTLKHMLGEGGKKGGEEGEREREAEEDYEARGVSKQCSF